MPQKHWTDKAVAIGSSVLIIVAAAARGEEIAVATTASGLGPQALKNTTTIKTHKT